MKEYRLPIDEKSETQHKVGGKNTHVQKYSKCNLVL